MNPCKLIDGLKFQDHFFVDHNVQPEAINFPVVIKNLKFLFRIKLNILFFQFEKNGSLIYFLPKTGPQGVMDF